MNRSLLNLLVVILYLWPVLAKASGPFLKYTDWFLEDCRPFHDDPGIQYAYLTGGPGGRALYKEKTELSRNHPFEQNRYIIIIDFRGIGLSEPEFCNELHEELCLLVLPNLTPADATERTIKLFEKCLDSLKERGLNLNKYT